MVIAKEHTTNTHQEWFALDFLILDALILAVAIAEVLFFKTNNALITPLKKASFLTSERSEEVPFFIAVNGPGKGSPQFAVFMGELDRKIGIS